MSGFGLYLFNATGERYFDSGERLLRYHSYINIPKTASTFVFGDFAYHTIQAPGINPNEFFARCFERQDYGLHPKYTSAEMVTISNDSFVIKAHKYFTYDIIIVRF